MKPGPAISTFATRSLGAKLRRNDFGELARLFTGLLGEHHGDVGCHVAVGLIAWRLDGDARQIDVRRQIPGRDQFVADAANALEHFGEDVMRGHDDPCSECSSERRAPNAIPGSS